MSEIKPGLCFVKSKELSNFCRYTNIFSLCIIQKHEN